MGRPTKSDKARLGDLIRIRVTEEQKLVFEEVAQIAGLDVSSWLRSLGVREVQRVRKEGLLAGAADVPATAPPEAE